MAQDLCPAEGWITETTKGFVWIRVVVFDYFNFNLPDYNRLISFVTYIADKYRRMPPGITRSRLFIFIADKY